MAAYVIDIGSHFVAQPAAVQSGFAGDAAVHFGVAGIQRFAGSRVVYPATTATCAPRRWGVGRKRLDGRMGVGWVRVTGVDSVVLQRKEKRPRFV